MNYQIHYDNLINRARNRVLETYTESHHIIPRCMGGLDDLSNLVELTPEEHYVAHQLLVKIYPFEPKLVMAARYMTVSNDKNQGRSKNRMFGWLRRQHANAMREINIGRKQSQETIDKRQESRKWYSPSKETKQKISESNKGKKRENFTPHKGVPMSDEQKKKISETKRINRLKKEEASNGLLL